MAERVCDPLLVFATHEADRVCVTVPQPVVGAQLPYDQVPEPPVQLPQLPYCQE